MKKWIIIGITIAVVVIASVGAVGYVVLQQASSRPDVVESMAAVPGTEGGTWHATWCPDGKRILFESHGVLTTNPDGTDLAYLGEGDYPVWSPDGSRIAFATDNGLAVMDADGTGRELLADYAEFLQSPLRERAHIGCTAWSPDGASIAFVVQSSIEHEPDEQGSNATHYSDIWIVAPDGSGLRQLTMDAALGWHLVWSPDSRSIAFISSRDDTAWDIWVVDLDGSRERRLTTGEGTEWAPAWSPDGARIAYSTSDEIWVMDADGGNPTRVATVSKWCDNPAWSPDGTMIAFDSTIVGPVGNIWIVNADGTGRTKLTGASRSSFTCNPKYICYEEPKWSPDGTEILFLNRLTEWEGWGSSTSGYDRLWVLELNLENGLN